VSAVEMALRDLGVPVEVGAGVAAAQRVLYEALAGAPAEPPKAAVAAAGD
jgi:hypothetical protein